MRANTLAVCSATLNVGVEAALTDNCSLELSGSWQYETYVERFRPDTVRREAAFNRFVKFPSLYKSINITGSGDIHQIG